MFSIALLLLLEGAPAQATVLKAELREIPAASGTGFLITADGSTNLPDGAVLKTYLYYRVVDEGRAVATDFATVKGGKFSQDFSPFPKSPKNLPGKYIARFNYNPGLQNLAIAGFDGSTVDVSLSLGSPEDYEREAKLIRARLAGELQSFAAMADEVRAKLQELKGQPAAAWGPLLKSWGERAVEIEVRSHPDKVPEYKVLNLDVVADSGLEDLANILNSAAKFAAAGRADDALEGLARLRQSVDHWTADVASPRISSPAEIVALLESARKLVSETTQGPASGALPARRRFVEMNALLQRSLPEELQAAVIEIGSRSTAFFNAVSDQDARARDLAAELDRQLGQLAARFHPPK